jgi:Tfp pilus assembly protein PilE
MAKLFWKGLKVIDLIVLLILLGGLIGLVAWRYDDFKCRAIESEAKFFLQEYYAAEQAFFNTHNRYASVEDLNNEGRMVTTAKYFNFIDFKPPTAISFSIAALGIKGLVLGEQWTIDHHNEIVCLKSTCNKQ